MGLYLPRRQT
jgi:hypothetical protein